jgi:hypothetical protein
MEELQPLFAMEQSGMLEKLGALAFVIGCIDPELMRQLEESESDHLLFCFQWMLIFFKREFERNEALIMWDVLFTQYLSRDFSIFVCASMVEDLRDAVVGKALANDEILKVCGVGVGVRGSRSFKPAVPPLLHSSPTMPPRENRWTRF